MYSLKFSGFWRRFFAFLLDLIILYIITYVILAIVKAGFLLFGGVKGTDLFEKNDLIIKSITYFVLSIPYFTFFMSTSLSSTIGQLLFKIKVTDTNENHITFGRAFGRYFAFYLSILTLFIGVIMSLYNPNRQMLHDKICKTYVIER